MKRLSFFFFWWLLSYALKGAVPPENIRILFVGNSLSYFQDMPGKVEELARQYDVKLETTCLCQPNFAIIDHLEEGSVQNELNRKKFDWVIFQQGPSSQPVGKQMLIEAGAALAKLSRLGDATPAYLMVWPSITYYHTFEAVIKNHQLAAQINQIDLIPAGIVWKIINKIHAGILYSPDGFHPSPVGSFLVALTIFHRLYPDLPLENLSEQYLEATGLTSNQFQDLIHTIQQVQDTSRE